MVIDAAAALEGLRTIRAAEREQYSAERARTHGVDIVLPAERYEAATHHQESGAHL